MEATVAGVHSWGAGGSPCWLVLAHSCLHTVLVVREHALQQGRAPQTVAKRVSFQERGGRVWGDPR